MLDSTLEALQHYLCLVILVKHVSTVPTPAQGATVAVLQVFPHVLACLVYEADLTGSRWLTRGFIKESDS